MVCVQRLIQVGERWQTGLPLPEVPGLLTARQVLGGAVAPPRGRGGSREARRAAWHVVVTGLELQVLVDEGRRGFSAGVRRRVQLRRRTSAHLRAWRAVVLRGGPARAAALARVSTARAAAMEVTSKAVGEVELMRSQIQQAVGNLASLALSGTAQEAPVTALWLRVWLMRWSCRAEELRRRGRQQQAPRLRAALRFWSTEVSYETLLRGANAEFGVSATTELAWVGQTALGMGLAVPWEAGGVEGRRWRDEDGVWRCVSAARGLSHSWRAWAAAGGQASMARERGRLREESETRRAARLVDWKVGLGGQPSPALAALANARRLLRQRPAARRRMLENEEVGSGVAPDGRGRWAVEQVVEWRGGARDREARIRWCGFDPETGEPWEDSWVPRAFLSADLRRGGLIREARRRREGAEEGEAVGRKEEDVLRRKSQRVAGLEPGPGLGGMGDG